VQDAETEKTNARDERGHDGTGAEPNHDASAAPSDVNDPGDIDDARAPTSDSDRLRNLALFVPRLLQLIGRLVTDPEVPLIDKVILGAAAAYVVSPLDIMPDAVPLLGQIDDIYLIAICLLRLMHRSGEAKLRQHWDGPEDIVQILHNVTDIATRYLPGKVRTYLRNWVESKPPA